MGVSTSKKIADRFTGLLRPAQKEDKKEEDNIETDPRQIKTDPSEYLVTTRRSSQFFDEEGFLAHEFWEEVPNRSPSEPAMRKVTTNLTPQGEVPYEVPRLRAEYPYVVAEPPCSTSYLKV